MTVAHFWGIHNIIHITEENHYYNGRSRTFPHIPFDERMRGGDIVYLFRGDEYLYGWGSITRLGEVTTTNEGLRREVTVIQTFLQSQLVSVEEMRRAPAFSNYDRIKNGNLSHFDEQQAQYLNARFPHGQEPPNPVDMRDERQERTPRLRPVITDFVRSRTLTIDETRFDEFKTVAGQNNVTSIVNEIDDYVVAFLNLEDRRDESHCRIFFGIQDHPHIVVGVTLSDAQRDDLRLRVSGKLALIEPRIASSTYYIELHPVKDESAAGIPNLYVVEIGVARGEPGRFYCTASGSFFIRQDGRNLRLTGQQLLEETRRRLLAQTQEAVVRAMPGNMPSFSLRFNARTDYNRLKIKNVGSSTAKNIRVDDVPLNNPSYPGKTINFRPIPTLQPNEEASLIAEYLSFGDSDAQNRSGLHQDPSVSQFLNNVNYTLTARFTDIHDQPHTQTLIMEAGRFTPGPTN